MLPPDSNELPLPDERALQSAAKSTPGAVVISAIDGTAGIGKTTLAVYWAHQVRDRFPDGALYANLRGYGPGQPAEPGEVVDGFLRALGVPPGRIPVEIEERAALYRSLLDERRILVLLDNANSPAQVRPLLPASRTCLAVVTSRSSLTGLIIAQGAARLSLDLLPEDEAVALLRQIVGHERADSEPRALVGIAQACVRLPLALRIAGQRAVSRPRLSLAEVLAELSDQRERLDALSATDDEATAVRSVFAWSYQALHPSQALVFRRIGLHPGVEIDVYAAAALADISPAQVRRILEALADGHLVEPTARDRYKAHDLLRAYALERAELEEVPADRNAALQRLLGFYMHTANVADRLVLSRNRLALDATPEPTFPLTLHTSQQSLEWFKVEYPNLISAISAAVEAGLHALAWRLTSVLHGLFEYDGNRSDWISALASGVASAQTVCDRRGEQYMIVCLSEAEALLRQFDRAAEHALSAIDIAQEIDDQSNEASALIALGLAHFGMRQFEDAAECYKRSFEIFQQCGEPGRAAVGLNFLGEVYQRLGRLDDAIACHQNALDTFRATEDLGRQSWALRLLGNANRAANHLNKAIDCHSQALNIARKVGGKSFEADALADLGEDAHSIGDVHTARERWQQALQIFERLGDSRADDLNSRLKST